MEDWIVEAVKRYMSYGWEDRLIIKVIDYQYDKRLDKNYLRGLRGEDQTD